MRQFLMFLFLEFFSLTLFCQDFEVYVCDAGNFDEGPWQIVSFDSFGENPKVFIDTELEWPTDMVFLDDQDAVLVSNLGSGRITKYDIETGDFIEDFAQGIVNGPSRMRIGPDSLIYISKFSGDGLMHRYELDGTHLGAFTNVKITECYGFDWDTDGNLYMSSATDDNIRVFDTNGNFIRSFVDPDDLSWPGNIRFTKEGNLFVLDYIEGVILFDLKGNLIGDFTPSILFGEGIAFFDDESFLIGVGGGSVEYYSASGNFLGDFISPGIGNLLNPNDIVIRYLNPPLSVKDSHLLETNIYPNFGTQFYIQSNELNERLKFHIYKSDLNLVKEGELNEEKLLDATGLPNGVYFIRLFSQNKNVGTHKIIVFN